MPADPGELYELHLEESRIEDLHDPVLVHALDGFIDAGSGVKLAVDHLLAALPHTVIGHFDVDQLIDYRSRRPVLTFEEDKFTAFAAPELNLYQVTDGAGQEFLLLTGPEPDSQWERFIAAVGQIVDRFAVRLTLGMTAIPMGVPHTRPSGMSAHSTREGLLASNGTWVGSVQVPGYASGLLEFRFGQAGRDAAGFAVHVPHYLARSEYPEAARQLLQAVSDTSGLTFDLSALTERSKTVRGEVDEQVANSEDVAEVVHALERQYDAFVSGQGKGLLAGTTALPTADELGAEFEAFLADQQGPGRD
ncbi:PAC2 family protein [Nakamurella silvestris]|nr:PAC2 family protein [Nakamurella silvestris]